MAEEQTGGAAAPQSDFSSRREVKREDDGLSKDEHRHTIKIRFGDKDPNVYPVPCTEPQTVLAAIKTRKKYESLKYSDQKIMIEMRWEGKVISIPTHFPCTLLKDEEILFVRKTAKEVEEVNEPQTKEDILSKDKYSVFYIDSEGGQNTETKPFLKSNEFKKLNYLCVYGNKEIPSEENSVRKTLEQDGRFDRNTFSQVSSFTLTDNDQPDTVIQCNDPVEPLQGKYLKITFPWGEGAKKKRESERTRQLEKTFPQGEGAKNKREPDASEKTRRLEELVKRSGFCLKKAEGESGVDPEEIGKDLPEQFPELSKVVESRFPGNSFQEVLNKSKEKFAEIQQSFRDVSTHRTLLERGQSVCQVVIEGEKRSRGTGFVLFDNFIMTNAHLFRGCTKGKRLLDGTKVHVLFNYEKPESNTSKHYVQLSHKSKIKYGLDYAILEIQPEGQHSSQTPSGQTEEPSPTQTEESSIPPGLLEELGKMPEKGGLCIIGHPNGEVKKMDLTCIIEPEKREQAVCEELPKYRDLKIIFSIVDMLKRRSIEKLMMGEGKAVNLGTYKTFMYHGSSGSPVFDTEGRVWGLHSAGYDYKVENSTESVIEFAYPLETIIKDYVNALIQENNQEQLRRIHEVAEKNTVLQEVLESVRGGASITEE
ncbi:protein FAM111A [Xyrichtys novacula]|uniref:Protein FAM111A n=1 Tax=Xyrichtys novacula TaxID=13765 RepID=A0AAV1GZW6_XYRNO|nr:protein FAM111A [Xyrichtys novacula]